MPPRFAYWTILIDDAPTAFRARDADELLPTLNQLKRTNDNVVLKWFSGGKLWDSVEAARDARRRPKVIERRGKEWRPGGQHKDPRARFAKKDKPRHTSKPHRPATEQPTHEQRKRWTSPKRWTSSKRPPRPRGPRQR